tara:strand:- start:302 stop:430 length:129 start_codon:yes stop_codon:yes gene_type:complete
MGEDKDFQAKRQSKTYSGAFETMVDCSMLFCRENMVIMKGTN